MIVGFPLLCSKNVVSLVWTLNGINLNNKIYFIRINVHFQAVNCESGMIYTGSGCDFYKSSGSRSDPFNNIISILLRNCKNIL